MRSLGRSGLGGVAVFCAAFGGMAFQLAPTNQAKLCVVALAPFVGWLALPDRGSTGGCPSCRSARRHQTVTLGSTVVEPATVAGSQAGSVSVKLGWNVSTAITRSCGRCGASVYSSRRVFVDRDHADTAAEATVLGRSLI